MSDTDGEGETIDVPEHIFNGVRAAVEALPRKVVYLTCDDAIDDVGITCMKTMTEQQLNIQLMDAQSKQSVSQGSYGASHDGKTMKLHSYQVWEWLATSN